MYFQAVTGQKVPIYYYKPSNYTIPLNCNEMHANLQMHGPQARNDCPQRDYTEVLQVFYTLGGHLTSFFDVCME
jgi:hypothetical protein